MKNLPSNSRMSFFLLAAWYSCITPFVSAGVLHILIKIGDREGKSRQWMHVFSSILVWILISSLVSGVLSLNGMPKHGTRMILPKAIVGIVFSLGVGFIAVVLWAFSGMSS